MQSLAKYDPYAIQQIEFFVQKKSKYTTLKSIIVTLAIFAITIYLNMDVINHLWIPRSQLPLVSNSRKMSLEPFTSTYYCVFPKTKNISLPKTTLINYNHDTDQIIKTFSITDKFNTNSDIIKVAAGRDSVCYDIQGAVLSTEFQIKLLLFAAKGCEFDFMLKTYSSKQLMDDKNQKPNYLYIEGSPLYLREITYSIQIKKISAIYYDQLLIDYEPERIFSFGTRQAYTISQARQFNASSVNIISEFYVPFDLTEQYEFTRYNIADILGRVLSWFSVLVLICAFGVSPILDFNYKVQLAQKLYDNQKLNSIDISILSYLKYLVSKIKRRLFVEDVLDTAFEQLEKDIDLLNLIKKQTMMKKLIKENETLNIPHKQVQNRNSQLNMDFSQVLLSKQIALQTESDHKDNESLTRMQQDSTTNESPLITQPDQRSGDNILTRFIKSFDIGQVQISLISNKGEGYKTSWNTIITILFLVLVMWFILFAGLFKLTPSYTVETIPLLHDDSIYPTVTLNPQDIIVRARKIGFTDWDLEAVIIDKNDQVILNVTLLTGADCDSYVQGMNETIDDEWMCLSEPITLENDGLDKKAKLGLRIVYQGFGFSVTNVEIKLKQYNLVNSEFIQDFIHIQNIFSSSSNYLYGSQSLIMDDPQNQKGLQFFWTLNKYTLTDQTVFKGISIDLGSEFIRVKKDIPSIWDVINNAWGIVVLSFTVFLSKITRYLNVKQRQNITRNEQNENRNDIVAIISTQYKLISTVFHDELKHVKYFYKTKINDWQNKDN